MYACISAVTQFEAALFNRTSNLEEIMQQVFSVSMEALMPALQEMFATPLVSATPV